MQKPHRPAPPPGRGSGRRTLPYDPVSWSRRLEEAREARAQVLAEREARRAKKQRLTEPSRSETPARPAAAPRPARAPTPEPQPHAAAKTAAPSAPAAEAVRPRAVPSWRRIPREFGYGLALGALVVWVTVGRDAPDTGEAIAETVGATADGPVVTADRVAGVPLLEVQPLTAEIGATRPVARNEASLRPAAAATAAPVVAALATPEADAADGADAPADAPEVAAVEPPPADVPLEASPTAPEIAEPAEPAAAPAGTAETAAAEADDAAPTPEPTPEPAQTAAAEDAAAPVEDAAEAVVPEPAAPPDETEVAEAEAVSPAAADDVRMHINAPGTVSSQGLIDIVASLTAAGYEIDRTVRVDMTISQTQVRFYHVADTTTAERAAESISGIARDFTDYRPSPPPGTLEIYVEGG